MASRGEAGVAMGGSAIVIAKTKARERELRLFDVFEMLPPPAANDDPKSHEVYRNFVEGNVSAPVDRNFVAHATDLLAFTRENMRRTGVDPEALNVRFVKGLYEDTLHVDGPVAFAADGSASPHRPLGMDDRDTAQAGALAFQLRVPDVLRLHRPSGWRGYRLHGCHQQHRALGRGCRGRSR